MLNYQRVYEKFTGRTRESIRRTWERDLGLMGPKMMIPPGTRRGKAVGGLTQLAALFLMTCDA